MSEETSVKNRKYGKRTRPCRRCGTFTAVIRSYDLLLCRRCFREINTKLGFNKYS